MNEASPGSLPGRLLAYLHEVLDASALAYRSPPERLTGGFDTAVFGFELASPPSEFEGPLVLRLFQDAGGPRRTRFEAAIHRALAAQGFPAPRVVHAQPDAAPLGNAFFIMERAAGVTALKAALRPGLGILRLPGVVGRLHARLHRVDAQRALEAIREDGFPEAAAVTLDVALGRIRDRVTASGLEGLEDGLRWLETHRPPPSPKAAVCHGDFHPLNILVDAGRVTGVVDWANAYIGDPASDAGCTRMIILCGPQEMSRFEKPLFQLVRRWSAWRYEAAYRRANPVPPASFRYFEALRCMQALVHAAEIRKGKARMQGEYAWSHPEAVKACLALFRKVTGVTLRLPPAPASPTR